MTVLLTLDWSTESWPALVREGPRSEYFNVECSDGETLEGPATASGLRSGSATSCCAGDSDLLLSGGSPAVSSVIILSGNKRVSKEDNRSA